MEASSPIPEHLRDRVWYDENAAYAFLVHAPITFAHSQLAVTVSPCIQEEDMFSLAAKHIGICIGRLRSTIATLDLTQWDPLSRYTETSGQYAKTLVLRASASERQGQYKIHLVPCFASHIEASNELFWERFDKKREGGGLLHWIGKREHIVDKDTIPLGSDAEKRISSFCLTGLAAILRAPTWQGKTV